MAKLVVLAAGKKEGVGGKVKEEVRGGWWMEWEGKAGGVRMAMMQTGRRWEGLDGMAGLAGYAGLAGLVGVAGLAGKAGLAGLVRVVTSVHKHIYALCLPTLT